MSFLENYAKRGDDNLYLKGTSQSGDTFLTDSGEDCFSFGGGDFFVFSFWKDGRRNFNSYRVISIGFLAYYFFGTPIRIEQKSKKNTDSSYSLRNVLIFVGLILIISFLCIFDGDIPLFFILAIPSALIFFLGFKLEREQKQKTLFISDEKDFDKEFALFSEDMLVAQKISEQNLH